MKAANTRKIKIIDTTLRDGSHAMSHQFNAEMISKIAKGLDKSNVYAIEVSHGDGMGGSSLQYGFSLLSDSEMLRAAKPNIEQSRLAILLLPGIGTREDLKIAAEYGVKMARIATHCTEADISEQHIGLAKNLGMEVVCFLMMAHMVTPDKLLEQALLMESYGADVIYIVDSAGALLPSGVIKRVKKLCEGLKIHVGFHGHNNLGLAIANSLAAVESGATYIDGTLRGLGAGSGNAQIEVLVAVFEKSGYSSGVNFYSIMDTAEKILEPFMKRPQVIKNDSLMLGYAGVYSSFLLHTIRAAQKYQLDPRDIIVEIGKQKIVGGQEDIIINVAYDLYKKMNKKD